MDIIIQVALIWSGGNIGSRQSYDKRLFERQEILFFDINDATDRKTFTMYASY